MLADLKLKWIEDLVCSANIELGGMETLRSTSAMVRDAFAKYVDAARLQAEQQNTIIEQLQQTIATLRGTIDAMQNNIAQAEQQNAEIAQMNIDAGHNDARNNNADNNMALIPFNDNQHEDQSINADDQPMPDAQNDDYLLVHPMLHNG